jgi:hypothetical protein
MSIQIRVAGLVASAIVASAASAQTAVEWKVSEGGNGHWYEVRLNPQYTLDWFGCRDRSAQQGGHLATISSAQENTFIYNCALAVPGAFNGNAINAGPFLGGYQPPNSVEPGGGWRWVTSEPWAFSNWLGGQPDNFTGCGDLSGEHHLQFIYGSSGWNDMSANATCYGRCNPSFVIEWDADCNNDGIVDYGQILRGELIDLNSNGVPDICETSISSVIPPSVPSQGGSTITIRGNFPPNPTVKVGGVVATNVNRISITQITATVPALLPGMTSVQVNDFTLPDAIYIRPECGSDLDQNGTVDAGDISIILLDFGPCYEPPAALAAPAPTPLLADEPAPNTGTAPTGLR